MNDAEVSLGERATSRLAIGSLICSLVLCCPLTTIVGMLLGLAALVRIHRDAALKGRAIAVSGILIGALSTGAQGYIGGWVYSNIWLPMKIGPTEALAAGFQGDITGFTSRFHGLRTSVGDDEARAFIDQLRDRYGEFVTGDLNQQGPPQGGPVMEFDYLLRFEGASIPARAQIIYADVQTGEDPRKLGWITVLDPALGDLTFPPPPEP